jgi:hypothetical protein
VFVGFNFYAAEATEFEIFTNFEISTYVFSDMSNFELAVYTLQRNHGHCNEELAELQSRFIVPPDDTSLERLAPMGLARRLLELENLQNLSNTQLVNIMLRNLPVNDLRIREELLTRLARFDDTNLEHMSTRELAMRLHEWGNLSALLSISPGVRELLILRLSRYTSEPEELQHLDTLELARRLSRHEVWRWAD